MRQEVYKGTPMRAEISYSSKFEAQAKLIKFKQDVSIEKENRCTPCQEPKTGF